MSIPLLNLCCPQESYFQWCFGVTEPDCFGAIDVNTGRSVLFVPKLPEEYTVWLGVIHSLGHFKAKYAVDDTKYTNDVGTSRGVVCINAAYL